ncbi:MAG: hypothetical protein HDS01_07895, partial [Bacteroides sp.]|nr:hypothetical protein [Bacteroides sp.]
NYNEAVPDSKLQPERSFAYELYHRWSSLLDQLPGEPISSHMLRLSGEITKHFKDEKGILSPDIVLHGGQQDTKHQLIACEIKRELKDKKEVLKDMIKLYHYLNLKKHVIKGDNDDAKYQIAVFIALNTSKDSLKEYINQIFKDFSRIKIGKKFLGDISKKKLKKEKLKREELKEAILRHGEKIRCISVDTSSVEKTTVEYISLHKCLERKLRQ